MKIQRIGHTSPLLAKVKSLGARNNRTLGFLPEGAFDEYALKRTILTASSDSGEFLGYLLYRLVTHMAGLRHVVIVHVCVAEEHRQTGVAKALLAKLRDLHAGDCDKIRVKCRRDFDANRMWPNLGFVCVAEITGRAGKPLNVWEYHFRELPLIALMEGGIPQRRVRAAIDANVFYRLSDDAHPSDTADSVRLTQEARAITSDWLADELDLFITDELYNEIERQEDSAKRRRRRCLARSFRRVPCSSLEIQDIDEKLRELFCGASSNSKRSDRRHLAGAIAGNVDFFVTQDRGLRGKRDAVLSRFSVRIITPGEMVAHVDELIREAEYWPSRLAGSRALQRRRLAADQLKPVCDRLRLIETGEKGRALEAQLRRYMASPDRYQVELCCAGQRAPMALAAFDRAVKNELSVPVLRAGPSTLAGTVLRYLLSQMVLCAAQEQRIIARVVDPSTEVCRAALADCGFVRLGHDWVKCNPAYSDTSARLMQILRAMQAELPSATRLFCELRAALGQASAEQDRAQFAKLERWLWPAKILDASLPTYVVPIHPRWALHLFDEQLAAQDLWGASETLSLLQENVYYRSAKGCGELVAPARILWYVTGDERRSGSMCIRACSLLDQVITGRAKDVYRQFARLGVYEWKDVLATAGGRAEGEVMVLEFSSTQRLPIAVSLAAYRRILRQNENKGAMLQSPQRIRSDTFSRIVTCAGMCRKRSETT